MNHISNVNSQFGSYQPVNTYYQNHQLNPFYNNLQKESENKHMSLVGIIKTKNGIVAFADTKSTLYDVNGGPKEENNRIVKKMFINPKFIITTYGNNKCIENNSWVPLETLINKIIKKEYNSVSDFLDSLNEMLKKTYATDNNIVYNFIVSEKDADDDFYVADFTLSKSGCRLNNINYNYAVTHCRTPCCPLGLNPIIDENLEFTRKGAELLVKNTIELGNYYLHYNPVGGDVYSASMDNDCNISTYINGKKADF